MPNEANLSGWVVIEMMGHKRLAGFATEVTIAGAGMIRLDVPATTRDVATTKFISPTSLYCVSPVLEETARKVAEAESAAPVQRWEMILQPREEMRSLGSADDDADEEA